MIYLYILLAKFGYFLIKTFHLGSGYTWPGYVSLKFNPSLLSSRIFKYKQGIIVISGTNGKTTTATLLCHILQSSGLRVVHNKTGGNILNGIASTLLLDATLFKSKQSQVAVLEVDELALPILLKYIQPSVLMLLNLSRDQLDRYGEVDLILDKWKETVSTLSSDVVLVTDSEQESFKELTSVFKGRVFYFDSNQLYLEKTKLHGVFNAKNINSAVLTSGILGLGDSDIEQSLETFEAAYGRGEEITFKNKHFNLFLAKNPSSLNHNLDLISSNKLVCDTLLFILNDEIRDGRDVSWIYDVDPLKLKNACDEKQIYVSGSRYLDMSIRLDYAENDVDNENITSSLKLVIDKIVDNDKCNDIIVLPNYSSMLELREILVGRQIL